MGDMGEIWKGHREAQRARRAERLPKRTEEIEGLRRSGFTVEPLTPYQFRIDGALDFYPIHRRYHVLATGRRGTYRDPKAIAMSVLRAQTFI